MFRSVRRALIAGLVVLHASVTLCGSGLHTLPGWRHDFGFRPVAKTDHSHGPGKSSHAAADDCPVCQFLAQGQLAVDYDGVLIAGLASGLPSAAAPDADQPARHRPSAPRAPPFSSSQTA